MPLIIRAIFALIVAGVVIPLGLWTAYKGALLAIEASQSAAWPTTPGQVISSHVQTSTSHGRHHGTSYSPAISYTYAVSGTTYTGTMVAPGRTWGSKSSYAAVKAHPPGQADVHYDPAHPGTAVLEPGLHSANFGETLLGLSFATFGSLFALLLVTLVPASGGQPARFRRGGCLLLPIVGLLVAEFVALIWLS